MAKSKKPKNMQAGMMDQLRRMQEDIVKAQSELEHETVEASAGGGAVRVVMTGTQVCQSVTIDPQLVDDGDPEMLGDLLMLAVNQAIHDSQSLAAKKLDPMSGGLSALGLG
jgi:DNA-binding YbaB/EbfC family protein